MRAIDGDLLKTVLDRNFGDIGGASVLAQLIDAQPTIASRPDWTPCDEGLPESGKKYKNGDNAEYLVEVVEEEYGGYQQRYIAMFVDKTWLTQSGNEFEDYETVLAWQPLHEPYNPDEKEKP